MPPAKKKSPAKKAAKKVCARAHICVEVSTHSPSALVCAAQAAPKKAIKKKAPKASAKKDKKDKKPRAPSAYNIFMKAELCACRFFSSPN